MTDNIDNIIQDIEFVYVKFRKASSEFNNRPYKLPKDFKSHLYNRMSKPNRENLIKITKNFITKWERINIEQYFRVGFKLFGRNFSYSKFLNEKIMIHYKDLDKNIKRDLSDNKKKFIKSAKFVKKYLKEKNITMVDYCNRKDGYISIIVRHYNNNYIDKIFVIWLIKSGKFYLSDEDKILVPYVVDNYRKLYIKLEEINDFVIKVKEMLK